MYWIVRKLWLPTLVQILWWGWKEITPPPALDIVMFIVAMIGLAGAAKYLVYSTLNIDDAYRLAELFVLTTGWVGVLAIVVLLTLSSPMVGLAGGAFLIYIALDAFPRASAAIARVGRRAIRSIRQEDAALRRDDPNWKPAVTPPVWPRRATSPEGRTP